MSVLFTQIILFMATALIGFALGWRLFILIEAERQRGERRDIEQIRHALSDAQVQRVRP